MSHFLLFVIGDNIKQQLAPFNAQPYDNDPYAPLVFDDQTHILRKEYEEEEGKIIKYPDGSWSHAYGVTENDIAAGRIPVFVKFTELFPTFDEFCRKWHYLEPNKDGRYGRYWNPNGKWDWWAIGGHWYGFFKAKPDVVGKLGEPSAYGNKTEPGRYDQLPRGGIDFEGMRADAAADATKIYDAYEEAVKGLEVPKPWAEFRTEFETINAARDAFHELPYIKALYAAKLIPPFEDPVEMYGIGREKFIERAVNGACVPYAVLKDGEWHAKGEMNLFGISSNNFDPDTWNAHVWELLCELSDDTLITAIDCHI